jgi:hypothetical protein
MNLPIQFESVITNMCYKKVIRYDCGHEHFEVDQCPRARNRDEEDCGNIRQNIQRSKYGCGDFPNGGNAGRSFGGHGRRYDRGHYELVERRNKLLRELANTGDRGNYGPSHRHDRDFHEPIRSRNRELQERHTHRGQQLYDHDDEERDFEAALEASRRDYLEAQRRQGAPNGLNEESTRFRFERQRAHGAAVDDEDEEAQIERGLQESVAALGSRLYIDDDEALEAARRASLVETFGYNPLDYVSEETMAEQRQNGNGMDNWSQRETIHDRQPAEEGVESDVLDEGTQVENPIGQSRVSATIPTLLSAPPQLQQRRQPSLPHPTVSQPFPQAQPSLPSSGERTPAQDRDIRAEAVQARADAGRAEYERLVKIEREKAEKAKAEKARVEKAREEKLLAEKEKEKEAKRQRREAERVKAEQTRIERAQGVKNAATERTEKDIAERERAVKTQAGNSPSDETPQENAASRPLPNWGSRTTIAGPNGTQPRPDGRSTAPQTSRPQETIPVSRQPTKKDDAESEVEVEQLTPAQMRAKRLAALVGSNAYGGLFGYLRLISLF